MGVGFGPWQNHHLPQPQVELMWRAAGAPHYLERSVPAGTQIDICLEPVRLLRGPRLGGVTTRFCRPREKASHPKFPMCIVSLSPGVKLKVEVATPSDRGRNVPARTQIDGCSSGFHPFNVERGHKRKKTGCSGTERMIRRVDSV